MPPLHVHYSCIKHINKNQKTKTTTINLTSSDLLRLLRENGMRRNYSFPFPSPLLFISSATDPPTWWQLIPLVRKATFVSFRKSRWRLNIPLEKCFVYSGSALSYQASSQTVHSQWSERHNLNLTETLLRSPTGRRQPAGYLQRLIGLIPGQPETNPDQRLERDLNTRQPHANPTP